MIIGLTGAKRSGKNTAANLIAKNWSGEYNVKEFSFAKKLKESALAALGIEVDDPITFCDHLKQSGEINYTVHTPEGHGYYAGSISGRQYLQNYGTEAHRDIFGQSFWVDVVLEEIYKESSREGNDLFLITDVRFENEAKAIRNEPDGFVFRLKRGDQKLIDKHVSEKPLPTHLVDFEVDNNGTIEELGDSLNSVVNFHRRI